MAGRGASKRGLCSLPRQLHARCSPTTERKFCARQENIRSQGASRIRRRYVLSMCQSPSERGSGGGGRPGTVLIGPVRPSSSRPARRGAVRARVCCLQGSLTPLRRSGAAAYIAASAAVARGRCHGGPAAAETAVQKILLFMGLQNCTHWSVGRLVGRPSRLSSLLLKFDMPLLSLSFPRFVAGRPLCALLQSFEIWRLFLEELFCRGAAKD